MRAWTEPPASMRSYRTAIPEMMISGPPLSPNNGHPPGCRARFQHRVTQDQSGPDADDEAWADPKRPLLDRFEPWPRAASAPLGALPQGQDREEADDADADNVHSARQPRPRLSHRPPRVRRRSLGRSCRQRPPGVSASAPRGQPRCHRDSERSKDRAKHQPGERIVSAPTMAIEAATPIVTKPMESFRSAGVELMRSTLVKASSGRAASDRRPRPWCWASVTWPSHPDLVLFNPPRRPRSSRRQDPGASRIFRRRGWASAPRSSCRRAPRPGGASHAGRPRRRRS